MRAKLDKVEKFKKRMKLKLEPPEHSDIVTYEWKENEE